MGCKIFPAHPGIITITFSNLTISHPHQGVKLFLGCCLTFEIEQWLTEPERMARDLARITSISSFPAGSSPGQGSYTTKSAWRKRGQERAARSTHLSWQCAPPTIHGQLNTSWSWCLSQAS